MKAIYSVDKVGQMELRQVEHFLAVAAEMSFTRGAERAHVVQSALSTSIAITVAWACNIPIAPASLNTPSVSRRTRCRNIAVAM